MYFLTFFSGGCKSEVSVSEEWVSLKASLIDLEMTALALHNLLLVHVCVLIGSSFFFFNFF